MNFPIIHSTATANVLQLTVAVLVLVAVLLFVAVHNI